MGKPKAGRRTTTEAEIRRLVDAGKTFVEIADEVGVPLSMLRQACSVLGIRSPYAEAKAGRLFADFSGGASVAEIAAKNDVTPQAVYQALKRAGLPHSDRALAKWLIEQRA